MLELFDVFVMIDFWLFLGMVVILAVGLGRVKNFLKRLSHQYKK